MVAFNLEHQRKCLVQIKFNLATLDLLGRLVGIGFRLH